MERPTLAAAVDKLAIVGEQVGFSLEQMICLLDAGMALKTLRPEETRSNFEAA